MFRLPFAMNIAEETPLPKWTIKSFPSADILAKKRRDLLLKRLSSLCRNENDQYVLVHPSNESARLWNILKDPGKTHCPQKASLLGLIRSIDVEAFLLETYLEKTYNNLSIQEIQSMLLNYVDSHQITHSFWPDKKTMLPTLVANFEEQIRKIVLQESKRICDTYCERTKMKSQFYCFIEWVLCLGIVPYETQSQQWHLKDSQLLDNAVNEITETHPHCGNLVKALYRTKQSVLSELKTCVIPDYSDCAIVISTFNRLNPKAIRISDGKVLHCQILYPPILDQAFKPKFTSPFSHIVEIRDHTREIFDMYENSTKHNAAPYRALIAKKSVDKNENSSKIAIESDELLKDVLHALSTNDSENIKSIKSLVKFTLALKSPENQDIVKTVTNVLTGDDFELHGVKQNSIDKSCISKAIPDTVELDRLAANGDFNGDPLLETTKQYNLQYNEQLQRESVSRSTGNWRDDSQSTGTLQGKIWTLAQQFMREKTKNNCLKKSIAETVKQYLHTRTELESCRTKYKEVLQKAELKRSRSKGESIECDECKDELVESSLEEEPLFKKRRIANENESVIYNGNILNLSKLQGDHETVNQAIISSSVPNIEFSLNRLDRIWSSIISDTLHFVSVRTYSNQIISRIPTRKTIEVLIKPFLRLVQLDSVANVDTVLLDDQERLPSDINIRMLNLALYRNQGIAGYFNSMKMNLGCQDLACGQSVKVKQDSRLGENIDVISESQI